MQMKLVYSDLKLGKSQQIPEVTKSSNMLFVAEFEENVFVP